MITKEQIERAMKSLEERPWRTHEEFLEQLRAALHPDHPFLKQISEAIEKSPTTSSLGKEQK